MPWWGALVRVLVVGCGRVGAGLAIALAERGDTVSVVDKDPRAFERLGERFLGHAVEGIAFDRDVLEQAGVARADALVAVTGGDNANVVAARIGRETYKVPRVIARIQDPRRATIYEELGITTVATVGWALGGPGLPRAHAPEGGGHLRTGRGRPRQARAAPAPGRPVRRRPRRRRRPAGRQHHPARRSPGPPGHHRPRRGRRRAPRHPGRRPRQARRPARRGDPPVTRILVAGAGVWGAYIADHLVEQGNEVVVVEQDAAAARQARARGGRVVIAGDACEPSVLDRAGLQTVDTVVAATGDDEDNLVVSLLAKHSYGVPRVVARVNNPKNSWLFTEDWGVDTAVSAPAILTRLLDAAVGIQDVVALLRSEHGGVALVEVTLDDDAPAVGRRADELELPERSVVVAVVRGERVLPGGGSGPLEPGDEVLAVTALATEPALRQSLGGHPGGSHIPGV